MRNFIFLVLCSCCLVSCNKKDVPPPPAVLPIPTKAQLAWHAMEMNAFVHFSTNTFTGKEWGYGDESPDVFNPTDFDADQWVRVFSETGFKGVILTCKHHDGFCLWPSRFTNHSLASSPWRQGKGDVVREVADACKKYGLKFGIYLSPWDRNHKGYGAPEYITYYRNQLKELFEAYGPVFEMWFDGANGGDGYYGGAREKRKIDGASYYQWPVTLDLVRSLSPNIIFFSDAGPGVRWVGNERGVAGETNWNTITPDTLYAGKGGIENLLNEGSENGTAWIPAETDVSIRPGWFYHQEQDSLVKSPERLFNIYLTSVGRGSTLLLNIPPDRRGLINEKDVSALKGFRKKLDGTFQINLAEGARVDASSTRGNSDSYSPQNLVDGRNETYWATDDDVTTGTLEITLTEKKRIQYVSLREYVELGQRVRSFKVEFFDGAGWQRMGEGTTIGHLRILQALLIETDKVRITITSSRACPVISGIGLY